MPAFLTKHLDESGITYGQHFVRAINFSILAAAASLALFIHAFLPFVFVSTGSTIIQNLKNKIVGDDNLQ